MSRATDQQLFSVNREVQRTRRQLLLANIHHPMRPETCCRTTSRMARCQDLSDAGIKERHSTGIGIVLIDHDQGGSER
jgi:hypothetical protein